MKYQNSVMKQVTAYKINEISEFSNETGNSI
jgi:hypothetical protein